MTRSAESGRIHPALAVLIGIATVVVLIMAMRSCIGAFTHVSTGHSGGSLLFPGVGLIGFPHGLFGIWGLLQIALAIWVGFDAQKNGHHGLLWGLLVFFTGIIGLIVYLIVAPSVNRRDASPRPAERAPAAATSCPECQAALRPEYKACPYCGATISCKQCGRAVQGGWNVCPFCATALE